MITEKIVKIEKTSKNTSNKEEENDVIVVTTEKIKLKI